MRYNEFVNEAINTIHLEKPIEMAIKSGIARAIGNLYSVKGKHETEEAEFDEGFTNGLFKEFKKVLLEPNNMEGMGWSISKEVVEVLNKETRVAYKFADTKDAGGTAQDIFIEISDKFVPRLTKRILDILQTIILDNYGEYELIDGLWFVIRSIGAKDREYMYSLYNDKYTEKTIDQIVTTTIHELVHVTQHNRQNEIGRYEKEHEYRSYLDKKKGEFVNIHKKRAAVQQRKIYVDMDGVIADFNSDFEKFGNDIKKLAASDPETIYEFYRNLKPLTDGMKLVKYLQYNNLDFEFLSAPLRKNTKNDDRGSEASKLAKVEWIKHYVPGYEDKVSFTSNKSEYAGSDNILIDDRDTFLKPWIKSGGIGIHYKNYNSTIEELKKILLNSYPKDDSHDSETSSSDEENEGYDKLYSDEEDERYNKLYRASPQEIAAFSHQIALKMVKDFNVTDATDPEDLKYMASAISAESIIDYVTTEVGRYYRNPENRKEYEVFKRYIKMVYSEIQAYLVKRKEYLSKTLNERAIGKKMGHDLYRPTTTKSGYKKLLIGQQTA
jgi:hypothetical protein